MTDAEAFVAFDALLTTPGAWDEQCVRRCSMAVVPADIDVPTWLEGIPTVQLIEWVLEAVHDSAQGDVEVRQKNARRWAAEVERVQALLNAETEKRHHIDKMDAEEEVRLDETPYQRTCREVGEMFRPTLRAKWQATCLRHIHNLAATKDAAVAAKRDVHRSVMVAQGAVNRAKKRIIHLLGKEVEQPG